MCGKCNKCTPKTGCKPIKLEIDKTCKTCKFYVNKMSGGYCGNNTSPVFEICVLPYYPKFGCTYWMM